VRICGGRRVRFPPATRLRLRPLGVAALEDKILQRAVVEVLNAVYELGRAGARCRRYRRSVSPTDPPAEPDLPIPEHPALHRTCDGRS